MANIIKSMAQVKEGFDRLLKVVQDTAREQIAKYQGRVMEALIEEAMEEKHSADAHGSFCTLGILIFPGFAANRQIGSIKQKILAFCSIHTFPSTWWTTTR